MSGLRAGARPNVAAPLRADEPGRYVVEAFNMSPAHRIELHAAGDVKAIAGQQDWAGGLGLPRSDGTMPSDDALKAHRDAYYSAIQAHHAEGKTPAARRSAY